MSEHNRCSTSGGNEVEHGTRNLSVNALAARLNMRPAEVRALGLTAAGLAVGLDGKARPTRRFDTSRRDAEIRARHEDGQSMRAIAAALYCSVGTVHRVVSEYRRGLVSP